MASFNKTFPEPNTILSSLSLYAIWQFFCSTNPILLHVHVGLYQLDILIISNIKLTQTGWSNKIINWEVKTFNTVKELEWVPNICDASILSLCFPHVGFILRSGSLQGGKFTAGSYHNFLLYMWQIQDTVSHNNWKRKFWVSCWLTPFPKNPFN